MLDKFNGDYIKFYTNDKDLSFYICKVIGSFCFSPPAWHKLVYATRDQWLQSSPITKLCFVILNIVKNLKCCLSEIFPPFSRQNDK